MALTKEKNDLITLVENGAPLGDMLRQHYWFPVLPSSVLEAGGAPQRVRLNGSDYVAFRAGNGQTGVFDEQCPHRGASMALAMNEHDGLRCIFHGWKLNVQGEVVEAPNHSGDEGKFCKSIRTNQYAVREAGGILWAWFGKGEPPVFPDFPFTRIPDSHVSVTTQLVPTNWLQGVEATVDTTHAGALHQSNVALASSGNERVNLAKNSKPSFEFEERSYGFRYAAVRAVGDGKNYARVNNFVMPWYGFITAPEAQGPATAFFSVPVDDTNHRAWFVHFNLHGPIGITQLSVSPDPMNFPPLPPGDGTNNWGQNRSLMKRGFFSGFPQHFATEDFAVFLSQGPRMDRTREQLCSSDRAVVMMRNQVLQAVQEFMEGEPPKLARGSELKYSDIVSFGGVYGTDKTWRALLEDRDLYGCAGTGG
ncbi:MAG: Rieske 2Fe-2S domain-containing protein [Hydrogenophaga sp.]|jgi:phenylpropionate dioxygenase-like ring-hydroxylating dioxygenase large terminal subunit|uniref:Rieske 2Fe-2S domain-containing protein n=1 Tax=Hydrogenophaga sp. TaxID=1904254 RepID=UPI00271E6A90|nr:Rieske 2Fe-2S domain-containing protein [Hydrogenophaga sp.]MDO9482906.1 Rieske 2Fe-2S domain-containing protein [Hydrogenophaga sp.]MDP1895225.1 Rieske 2Fe-2S domain-containing protein [Hydrogenophaga sp.]MDP3343972.1 Rieske 2Fe-2S domain-containing protein [Hydrogenophaga sp.]MDP3807616.1 Rieske 2Fe-2S domain-containing protein [Hydrogenophaga sp.]MDP3925675.1 Rieske 2Fe-2S domain-containing protein [Hydrogenophaga sp.]